ncbi:MAG: sugar phosphate isomerase/epimerase [Calditrichia bacterium]|jgi:sugar phosphate isomerase/epimerase|nr:sugar phosphate isomerase/epimerase [Calditrichia bacterium]
MMNRRKFVKTSAFMTGAIASGLPGISMSSLKNLIGVGGFTKELQTLSYEETARVASEIGWDGIECPVRPGGHVLPERVEDDLPRMVEALKKHNLTLQVMATSIHNPGEEFTERILKTASTLGIKYYRMGWWNYDFSKSIDKQLKNCRSQLIELAELNKKYNIVGVYQNHSGSKSIGAPIWDIYGLLKDIDPDHIGIHFDIGHATVEGGYAWPIHFHRMKSYIKAVIVKDFRWNYEDDEQAEVRWCPLGEGSIDPDFFGMLKEFNFSGPVTMHYEYEVEGSGTKKIENWIDAMKNDTVTLRKWLNNS